MKILLFAICFILLALSLMLNILLWIKVDKLSKKRKELKGMVLQNIASLENHKSHIERLITMVNQLEEKSRAIVKQQNPVPSDINRKEKNKNHAKYNNKEGEKRIDSVNSGKPAPGFVKTIYLGINSDDMFFDDVVQEHKDETSKFLARLYSETEGTFEPIDVERVRSASVSASLRRIGLIPVKDALSFNVVTPGKIHKEKGGWHIESPVVVEFIK